jgi:hypothetical protein
VHVTQTCKSVDIGGYGGLAGSEQKPSQPATHLRLQSLLSTVNTPQQTGTMHGLHHAPTSDEQYPDFECSGHRYNGLLVDGVGGLLLKGRRAQPPQGNIRTQMPTYCSIGLPPAANHDVRQQSTSSSSTPATQQQAAKHKLMHSSTPAAQEQTSRQRASHEHRSLSTKQRPVSEVRGNSKRSTRQLHRAR